MQRAVTEVETTAPEEPTLDAGTRFGRYEVLRLLGSGGFGHVYEATHRELGKRVALKVLHREYALHPTVRARFTREGQAASRLRHPNVVDVTDVGVCDGQPYLVMELLEGETLRACMTREGAMTPDRVVDLMLPVLDAIAEAHDQGLVHRDLKPENIFLSRIGARPAVPKVLDFGVVKLDAERHAAMLTGSGILLGTPSYMSPEQAQDVRDLDGRSDQFSLASIVYECLEGRRAFEAEGVLTTLQRVAHEEPAPMREALPEALRAAVARAMRKRPEERFASVRAFAAALVPFASEPVKAQWSTLRAEAPATPDAHTARAVSGPRTLQGRVRASQPASHARAGVWIAVALLATVATLVAWRMREAPQRPAQTAPTLAETPSAPAETAPRPAETAPRPAETPSAPAETAPSPAETPSAPAETAPRPAETRSRPAETHSTPAETERSSSRVTRRSTSNAADAGARARRVGANGAVIED